MDPKKLPQSVLMALGLTAAASQSGCTLFGPCLDIAVETDTDPDSDSDSDADSDTDPDSDSEVSQNDPTERLLDRQVLPADVAARLARRTRDA